MRSEGVAVAKPQIVTARNVEPLRLHCVAAPAFGSGPQPHLEVASDSWLPETRVPCHRCLRYVVPKKNKIVGRDHVLRDVHFQFCGLGLGGR